MCSLCQGSRANRGFVESGNGHPFPPSELRRPCATHVISDGGATRRGHFRGMCVANSRGPSLSSR